MLLAVHSVLDILLTIGLLVAGGGLIGWTLLSAVRAIVLPRSERVALNNVVFAAVRAIFYLISKRGTTYAARDRVMALIGPVGLLALPITWLSLLSVGYTLVYYAVGIRGLHHAYDVSGSALLTLGPPLEDTSLGIRMLVFSEAALGLLLVALLITYMPTIYTAFTKREAVVAQLELRAGIPPSAAGLVVWLYEMEGLSKSAGGGFDVWRSWEQWFMEIEESHTTLPVLTVFRSREAGRSWVTAAATILDAAVMVVAVVECPRDPYRDLCLKAGVITLNRISRFFEATSQPEGATQHPAAVFEREAFKEAYQRLEAAEVPLKLPEAVAWVAFQDLRGRYQEPLNRLAHLAMAPGG